MKIFSDRGRAGKAAYVSHKENSGPNVVRISGRNLFIHSFIVIARELKNNIEIPRRQHFGDFSSCGCVIPFLSNSQKWRLIDDFLLIVLLNYYTVGATVICSLVTGEVFSAL